MKLTIQPCTKSKQSTNDLVVFLSKPGNLTHAIEIAQRFERIAQLLGNGHLLALRACAMVDGADWLKSVAVEVSAVQSRLTLEWHELSAERVADGIERHALDGRATSLLGFLREQEFGRRRELKSHVAEVEKMRGRLAAAGLETEAIEVALTSTKDVNAERQREMEASLVKCTQDIATLEAFCADPQRSRSALGQELLSTLSTPQPHALAAQSHSTLQA